MINITSTTDGVGFDILGLVHNGSWASSITLSGTNSITLFAGYREAFDGDRDSYDVRIGVKGAF